VLLQGLALDDNVIKTVIQNAVSVAIGKNRLNAEIAFHIALKTRLGQLKNLSNAAISSRIGHILNHCIKINNHEAI